MGIICILAGSFVLMYPTASAIVLPKIFYLFLGIWGLMYGILLMITAFKGRGWVARLVGVLGIIFCVAMITNHHSIDKGLSIIWVAAWYALMSGIALIVKACSQRPVPNPE